ncbi:glycolate oxidase subunit GlcF [Marinimicrococcus flavescens]|uniref:Glycolate oxidase iron-sulfur subunit n=1 Tax=Marinimicrococcus flavescens TaxID=3031815 RepID=A0AAP4D6M0_9PROT|nr:glycolate oxidase subunit GlcF [Marinimicrococcus flavescens]
MQTNFTLQQLADPDTAEAEKILRACVHCGFCTATCPTFVLLGDELDSPRGRIYLLKDMLENDKPASAEVAKHIDRCLSCLSCMTTCPSGVHYMHLVDHGRRRIEETWRRPAADRWMRTMLATVLPRPGLFRLALMGAMLARPVAALLPARLRHLLDLAPADLSGPSSVDRPQVFAAEGKRKLRVALLNGCAQQVVAPEINEATVRLLTRMGVEVVVARGAGCCGALTHHMGKEAPALRAARATIDAWTRELDKDGLDAVVINASGCGTTVKDYGFMFRTDPAYAAKAERIAGLARDVSEVLAMVGLPPAVRDTDMVVAYHSACSMQHGQKITTLPKQLLGEAGFTVRDVPEGHLCCGSAGTYNLLQPEIAGQLKERKIANIERVRPEVIATGNVGCITQIASGTAVPICHTVELLDWATGGPLPPALEGMERRPPQGPADVPAPRLTNSSV